LVIAWLRSHLHEPAYRPAGANYGNLPDGKNNKGKKWIVMGP
jgi:hypothetical protein